MLLNSEKHNMFQRKHHEWDLAISSQVPSFELIKLLGSQERGWETENICKFQWLTCSNKVVEDTRTREFSSITFPFQWLTCSNKVVEDTRTRELSSITFPWRSVKVMWDPQSTCLCFFFALPSVPCDPRMRSINAFTVSVWHVWPSSSKSKWVLFGNKTRRVMPFAPTTSSGKLALYCDGLLLNVNLLLTLRSISKSWNHKYNGKTYD